jgi:hypothetical protein
MTADSFRKKSKHSSGNKGDRHGRRENGCGSLNEKVVVRKWYWLGVDALKAP